MTDDSDKKNIKNGTKKIRRVFSLSKNPFKWSHKYKSNKNEIVISDSEIKKIPECKVLNESEDSNSNQSSNLSHLSKIPKSTDNINTSIRLFRRSTFRKFLTRIAQHVTSVNIGANKHSYNSNVNNRVPPLSNYQWTPDQTPGVTGLKNHGNTCFMNAVLQCLSHTDILAEYFVLDQYKVDLKRRNKLNSRKFGTKGELTEQLANVLKALWTCKNESDHSTTFKAVVDRYGTQFRSSTQHDAQEFLFWLLDKVHEDLNTATKRRYKTIKNNYGRSDEIIAAETLANHKRCNNSFVQAVFQAQFRSSLTCPRCHKQSNTFDPFHCISVQLPQLSQQSVFVTVLYATQHPKQVKLGLQIPTGSPIVSLRQQLHTDTGIPANQMVLVDINENGFSRVFYDSQPITTLIDIDSIYCIEVPEMLGTKSSSDLMLLITNVKRNTADFNNIKRFGTPFCIQVNRDCSYVELQKKILKEMSSILRQEVFAYRIPLTEMFQIRLQDPSADPDTYIEQVEHPLFMEVIDMALSVLSPEAGPPHIKFLLEWNDPEKFFDDFSDLIVEHESVSYLMENEKDTTVLTLEECLEHYTKAETLSAEDAWRCPHCQQYLPVVKTLGLWSLPDILVIHFKRFRQQHEKGANAAKLTTTVKFPLNSFDMTPHLAKSSNSNVSINTNENGSPCRKRDQIKYKDRIIKDNRYDLYAVCYHQGDTLETGHYTAACKNPYDHQWYKFDDQRVSHVPTDQIQNEIVNNEAYILFYQRRNLDNSECSGSSSASGDHWVSRIAGPISLGNSSICSNSTTAIENNILRNCEKVHDSIDNNILDDKDNLIQSEKVVFETVKLKKKIENDFIFIEKTDETDIVDVEELDFADEIPSRQIYNNQIINNNEISFLDTDINLLDKLNLDDDKTTITPEENNLDLIWPTEIIQTSNDFNINRQNTEINFCKGIRNTEISDSNCVDLRHSFSNSSNYQIKECDTLSMLRNTGNCCSKDTLLFIDQQSHSLIDKDDTFLSNPSMWISPVTPHKLITVSPKN